MNTNNLNLHIIPYQSDETYKSNIDKITDNDVSSTITSFIDILWNLLPSSFTYKTLNKITNAIPIFTASITSNKIEGSGIMKKRIAASK